MRSASALLALLALVAVAVAGCGGSSKSSSGGNGNGCAEVTAPKPRAAAHLQPPASALDPTATSRVKVETNCGDFTITLAGKESPKTSASFVYLVRQGYFDHTIFHRVVPGFVIQGGDPTQSGSGGPGYSTVEEPPRSLKYVRGTVAMAKTASEAPGTAGSQFFVVTGAEAQLPPEYALLGKVTEGQDVVADIGKLGSLPSEKPTQTVEIEKMSVERP